MSVKSSNTNNNFNKRVVRTLNSAVHSNKSVRSEFAALLVAFDSTYKGDQ
jgi:hypothetical protein